MGNNFIIFEFEKQIQNQEPQLMSLQERQEKIQILENGLKILIERTEEILSKEDYNEFDSGIVRSIIR